MPIEMVDRRELSRREARRRRASAKSDTLLRTTQSCELASNALAQARLVVADPEFVKFLLLKDTHSVPKCLAADTAAVIQPSGNDPSFTAINLERTSLEFGIAWKFLYPLFGDLEAKAYLEATWPGFVSNLKDAFIALIVDGPFPHAMTGHRGRKHHESYSEE